MLRQKAQVVICEYFLEVDDVHVARLEVLTDRLVPRSQPRTEERHPAGIQRRDRQPGSVQLAACFTSSAIFASLAVVSFVSAYAVGHIEPSSRLAGSLNPSVA